jgi:parallel beta-helix repeat protein
MEKTRLFWILMLVAVLCLPVSSAFSLKDQHYLSKHIITVDNEPGDADYTSIKEALNHSNPGDTIKVYSGTYYENRILITKENISLIGMPYELGNGSDTGKLFINGKGVSDVIRIDARNVTVSGFHIENKGVVGDWVIVNINLGANNCTLSNNTLSYSSNSIIYCGSNFSKITNNIISDAGLRYGIIFGSIAHNNYLTANVIDRCPTGICFWGGSNTTVFWNRISNCSEFGIDIGGGGLNIFQFNTFENNYVGFHIYMSVLNKIKQNNFINNTYQAGYNLGLSLMAGNRFFRNYWDHPRLLPYPIKGSVLIIVPLVSFDWYPAREPYDIS